MEEAHFIFTSEPLELKSEGEDFFVEGYISTSDLDLVNDIVTKSCLMDMAEQMKERVIKFDVEHESFRGKSNLETEINKTTIPVAKVEDFLMDKKGLKVRAKLNKHTKRFNEVKGSIEDGFLDAFSIAYIPIKTVMQQKDGQEIRLLDKINLLNVAFTGNPVNTEARMTNVFAKSLDFLKDQEEIKKSHSKKWHRCVEKVRAAGGVRSPEAVCTAVLGEESYKSFDEEEEKGGPGSGPRSGQRRDSLGRTKKEWIAHFQKLYKQGKISRAELEYFTAQINKKDFYAHESELIKLQEAKMSEDTEKNEAQPENEAESENSESQEAETEQKDEQSEDKPEESAEESESESENAEVKALKEKVTSLEKEMTELKAKIKAPFRKSHVEQQDKSKQFEGADKSLNPLDVIG